MTDAQPTTSRLAVRLRSALTALEDSSLELQACWGLKQLVEQLTQHADLHYVWRTILAGERESFSCKSSKEESSADSSNTSGILVAGLPECRQKAAKSRSELWVRFLYSMQ
jgi:hypothetical protein